MNGRPWTRQARLGPFKEAEQVRLECQSSGGKPAPRIEWFNVSVRPESAEAEQPSLASLAQRLQVEPMRAHWQQKKPLSASDGSLLPLTSSSTSVSLSRFDLNSNFVCLVLPASPAGAPNTDQLLRSPSRLANLLALLKQQGEQEGAHASSAASLMSSWLRLPVLGEWLVRALPA